LRADRPQQIPRLRPTRFREGQQFVPQKLDVQADGAQRVPHLVRDLGGHLANGGQSFRLDCARLRRLQLLVGVLQALLVLLQVTVERFGTAPRQTFALAEIPERPGQEEERGHAREQMVPVAFGAVSHGRHRVQAPRSPGGGEANPRRKLGGDQSHQQVEE